MSNIQYEPSWGSVFLAIAKGEHLQPEPTPQLHWPVTCPNCLSEEPSLWMKTTINLNARNAVKSFTARTDI